MRATTMRISRMAVRIRFMGLQQNTCRSGGESPRDAAAGAKRAGRPGRLELLPQPSRILTIPRAAVGLGGDQKAVAASTFYADATLRENISARFCVVYLMFGV
jgi:hypothetical protein